MSDGEWNFPTDLVALRCAVDKAEADIAAIAAGPTYAAEREAAWERWTRLKAELMDHPYWAGLTESGIRPFRAWDALQRMPQPDE